MILDSTSRQVAFSAEHRFVLFVEGIACPFTQIEFMVEDGMVPRLAIGFPATEEISSISRRVRVHLAHREIVNDEWVLIFEGEMLTRGFQKSPTSRELTFIAYHVTGLLDQFAITALDPPSYILAQMAGTSDQEALLAAPIGNPLAAFLNKFIAAELGIADNAVTFQDWVKGSFSIYRRLIDNSRIAKSYINRAVKFHDVFGRLALGDRSILDWPDFATQLLAYVMAVQGESRGGRMSFLELVRTIASEFMHRVTIVPNAESYTRQIQVKPSTLFNAIPRCNVVYPAMSEAWAWNEDRQTKITRIQGTFLPMANLAGESNIQASRYFTVFAPSELQEKWYKIADGLGVKQVPQPPTDSKGKLILKAPADGIQFLTREEEAVGIVPDYYDIPRTLSFAVGRMLKLDGLGTTSLPGVELASGTTADTVAYTTVSGTSDKERYTKYLAFVSQALGHGTGIDPAAAWGGANVFKRKGEDLLIIGGTGGNLMYPGGEGNDGRVTFLALNTHVDLVTKPSEKLKGHKYRYFENAARAQKDLESTRCNYFITKEGVIIQVLGRHHMLFEEPRALPFGVRVLGMDQGTANALNMEMPPLGGSRDGVSKADAWAGLITRRVRTFTKEEVDANKLRVDEAPPGTRRELFDFGAMNETPETPGNWAWPAAGTLHPDFPGPAAPGVKAPHIVFTGLDVYVPGGMQDVDFGALNFNDGDPGQTAAVITIYNKTDRSKVDATISAKVRDGKRVVAPDGRAWYYLVFDRAAIDHGAAIHIKLTTASSLKADQRPCRPWVFVAGGTNKSGVPVPKARDASSFNEVDKPILRGDAKAPNLVCGNHGNVVIALEKGGAITAQQKQSAAFLLACIKEITSQKASDDSGSLTLTAAARKSWIIDKNILAAEDYFPAKAPVGVLGISDVVKEIKNLASPIQDKLYAAFKIWDKALADKKFKPLAVTLDEVPEGDATYSDPTVHYSKTAAVAAGTASTSERILEASTKPVDISSTDAKAIVEQYAAAVMNYQFYNRRFARQGFVGRMAFNPYMLVGYPCLLLDNSKARFHLVGYLHAVKHVITEKAAWTEPTYTHLRAPGLGEAIIPYREKRVQFMEHKLKGRFDTDTEEGQAAYLAALERDQKMVIGHLPWQLHSSKDRSICPFLYHGGYGLANKTEQDFSVYAAMAGYVGGDYLQHLVFADDTELNFGEDNRSGMETEVQLDARSIFSQARVYRPIQRIGQNNATLPQASLAAFDYLDGNVLKEEVNGRLVDMAARNLVVYQGLKDHKPIEWMDSVQAKIQAHARRVLRNEAEAG